MVYGLNWSHENVLLTTSHGELLKDFHPPIKQKALGRNHARAMELTREMGWTEKEGRVERVRELERMNNPDDLSETSLIQY